MLRAVVRHVVRVAGAFDLLAQLEQREAMQKNSFEAAILALENALVGAATSDGFEQLYQAALAHKRGLPPELQARCQSRLERIADYGAA